MAEILSSLSDTVRTTALQRFHLIRPFLEEDVPLPTLARQHALSLRTARRWVQRYRTGGLGALGVLSQIFVCRRFGMSAPCGGGRLSGQSVEQFGRSEALFPGLYDHLFFLDHLGICIFCD